VHLISACLQSVSEMTSELQLDDYQKLPLQSCLTSSLKVCHGQRDKKCLRLACWNRHLPKPKG
jgi:hypothetical protein